MMKRTIQKSALLLLSMLLILGTLGVAVYATDIIGIDISATKTNIKIGETAPVVIKALMGRPRLTKAARPMKAAILT